MQKYLISFIVISIVVYSLTWLHVFPRNRKMRTLFKKEFPNKNDPSDLSINQRLEWESLSAEITSSPLHSIADLITALINYPSIFIYSILLGKDEFGCHTMVMTSSIVWWLICALFI